MIFLDKLLVFGCFIGIYGVLTATCHNFVWKKCKWQLSLGAFFLVGSLLASEFTQEYRGELKKELAEQLKAERKAANSAALAEN